MTKKHAIAVYIEITNMENLNKKIGINTTWMTIMFLQSIYLITFEQGQVNILIPKMLLQID